MKLLWVAGMNHLTLPLRQPTVITPIKAAELKSTYIKLIRELHSLLEAITETDFQRQKEKVLDQMDKL